MTAVPPTKTLQTAAEFWHLPSVEGKQELIAGVVVETMPPGGQHGVIASELSYQLRVWTEQGAGGVVGVESGFVLARNPDTVRAPDLFYVRSERVPATGIPEAFWHLAPDLAVEVVSPSESAEEVRAKVRDYLQAGTPLMWVIYPRSREVVVHTPDGRAQTFGPDDILAGFDLLPAFSCPVATLFP